LLQQVILHPATARQVKDALVALFEKRDARRALAKEQPDSTKKPN
jgi:23S rRNA G2445 N2-methylase RlmL